jgi:hypothetical protein
VLFPRYCRLRHYYYSVPAVDGVCVASGISVRENRTIQCIVAVKSAIQFVSQPVSNGISCVLFLPTTPVEVVLHPCHDFSFSFLKDEASVTICVVEFVCGNPAGGVISSTGWFTQIHGSLTWLVDVKQCCITGRDLTVLCWVYL